MCVCVRVNTTLVPMAATSLSNASSFRCNACTLAILLPRSSCGMLLSLSWGRVSIKTQENSSTLPSHLHSAKDLLGISIKLVYLISTSKLPTASIDGIL